MSKKLTQKDFEDKSNTAHKGICTYLNSVYDGRLTLVEIYCTKHCCNFTQAAGLHMDGQTSCHECIVEKKMTSRLLKRRSNLKDGCKLCSKCQIQQNLSNFHPNKDGADGFKSVCKKCTAIKFKEKRKDPEHRAHLQELNRNYSRNNKDKCNAKSARRRAARIQAAVVQIDAEYEEFLVSELYNLAQLRNKVTGFKWEVDHIIPLTSDYVCGLHTSVNLQVISQVENRNKYNTWWPNMWLDSDFNICKDANDS